MTSLRRGEILIFLVGDVVDCLGPSDGALDVVLLWVVRASRRNGLEEP